MKLNELAAGTTGKVNSVAGSQEFQRRITAVGITPGCSFNIVTTDNAAIGSSLLATISKIDENKELL